jgi:hypothetical protein
MRVLGKLRLFDRKTLSETCCLLVQASSIFHQVHNMFFMFGFAKVRAPQFADFHCDVHLQK